MGPDPSGSWSRTNTQNYIPGLMWKTRTAYSSFTGLSTAQMKLGSGMYRLQLVDDGTAVGR
jgi:hypothetical protein